MWHCQYDCCCDRFCQDASDRLPGGMTEIKAHVFFRGVDWEHIRFGGMLLQVQLNNVYWVCRYVRHV